MLFRGGGGGGGGGGPTRALGAQTCMLSPLRRWHEGMAQHLCMWDQRHYVVLRQGSNMLPRPETDLGSAWQ